MSMKTSELRNMKYSELLVALRKTEDELFKTKIAFQLGQSTNSAKIGQAKRDLARIKTLLKAQEIAGLTKD